MPIASVALPVPPSGDGPIVSVSSLVEAKTVILSGHFRGSYTILANHAGGTFAPVLLFNSDGAEEIRQTISGAFSEMRVRSNAGTSPTTPVTVAVSALQKPGANLFTTLATLAPGFAGLSTVIDFATLFPPTGLENDINIICRGGFEGTITLLGSNDGFSFNPIGTFQASPAQKDFFGLSQVLEFSPLFTSDLVRYLRLEVQGRILAQTVITVGGAIYNTSAGSDTLSGTYNNGSVATDQTLSLSDSHGGGVVIIGSGLMFTGANSFEILAPLGGQVLFPRVGGLSVLSHTEIPVASVTAWNEVDLQGSILVLTGSPAAIPSLAMVHIGSGVINAIGSTVPDAYDLRIDAAPAGLVSITRSWSLGTAGAVQVSAGGLVLGSALSPPGENDLVLGAGATTVSQVNSGRLGYELAGQRFMVSANGGAYVPILTGPAPGLTQGSVVFAGVGGSLDQDNADFFWDNTGKRLGVGVAAAPTAMIHVGGSAAGAPGTGSFKLDPAVLLLAPESGTIESNGAHLYWTNALNVRVPLDNTAVATTLAQSYANGTVSADQTFVILDAEGGAVVVNGTTPGIVSPTVFEVDVIGGSVNFYTRGGFDVSSSISRAAAAGTAWDEVALLSSTLTLTGGPATVTKVAQVRVGAGVVNGAGNTVSDAYDLLIDGAPTGTATLTRAWSLGAAGAVQAGLGIVLGLGLLPPTENDLVVGNGATVVSQANSGRLGYQTGTQQFFVSANGGGYVPLLVGPAVGGFTQGSVPFGSATGTLIQNNPNFFWDNTNFRLGIGVASPTATLQIVQPIVNAAVPSALVLTGGAHTAITSANEDIGANFNFSATKQWATGSIATQREVLFQAPTYSFVGTSTITTAATVAISGAPIAGANATLTNPLAFWVQGGSSQFIGTQSVVSATGAKWNALGVGTSTLTLTGATTPVTALSLVTLAAPSVSAASAITIATAATLTIAGPPAGVGAGPATLTNPLALLVASGNSQFSNNVGINTTIGAVTSLEVVTGVSTSTAGNSTFPGTIKITNNGIDTTNAVGGLEWQYDVGGSGFKIGVVSGTSSLAVFKRDFSTAWTQMFGFKSNGNAGIPIGANFYKKFRVDTSPPASPTITAAAIDSVGWNGIDFLGTLTLGGAAGAVTTLNAVYIEAPTINASSAVVIADFFTCRIGTASFGGAGPASAARNWSLGVDGNTKFGGGLTIHSTDVNVAGPYIILATDYYLQVRRTATSAISLNLPSIAIVGNGFVIQAKDSGYNAAVNPITWVRNGADTIENVAGNYPQNVTGSLIKFTSNATTNNWELS